LAEPSPLEQLLAGLKPDELSPRDALELLYKIKSLGDGTK
jgi:DNA mismatch repair protein MutS